jgi:hypothetical protein
MIIRSARCNEFGIIWYTQVLMPVSSIKRLVQWIKDEIDRKPNLSKNNLQDPCQLYFQRSWEYVYLYNTRAQTNMWGLARTCPGLGPRYNWKNPILDFGWRIFVCICTPMFLDGSTHVIGVLACILSTIEVNTFFHCLFFCPGSKSTHFFTACIL